MALKHCTECGAPLIGKYHPEEDREIPWCEQCGAWRFPTFNTAVSVIVMDEQEENVILIQQYGRGLNVLVTGYVNCGEDVEDALLREVREELGLDVTIRRFNRSHYYARSNTLMLNFTAVTKEREAHPNEEVDAWGWFSVEESIRAIAHGSLSEIFLLGAYSGEYPF